MSKLAYLCHGSMAIRNAVGVEAANGSVIRGGGGGVRGGRMRPNSVQRGVRGSTGK